MRTATPSALTLPNSGALPHYVTANLNLTHTWKATPVGKVEGRLALINVFDKSYLLREDDVKSD